MTIKEYLAEAKKIYYQIYLPGHSVPLVSGHAERQDWDRQEAIFKDQNTIVNIPDLPFRFVSTSYVVIKYQGLYMSIWIMERLKRKEV